MLETVERVGAPAWPGNMRELLVIAGVALLTGIGCGGGQSSPSPPAQTAGTAVNTCAKAHQSRHVAYLVVQYVSGRAIQRCAGFDGDTISSADVMRATGIQYEAVGGAMCQIDHEPQQFGDCSSEQAHWSLWLYMGGAWTVPTIGFGQLQLHDREAMGWRYVVSPVAAPSPPPTPQPL